MEISRTGTSFPTAFLLSQTNAANRREQPPQPRATDEGAAPAVQTAAATPEPDALRQTREAPESIRRLSDDLSFSNRRALTEFLSQQDALERENRQADTTTLAGIDQFV